MEEPLKLFKLLVYRGSENCTGIYMPMPPSKLERTLCTWKKHSGEQHTLKLSSFSKT
jgi:hypothetical protein